MMTQKPIKVFCFSGCFALSDDFDGGVADALRAMADYHEGEGEANPNKRQGPTKEGYRSMEEIWPGFLDRCKAGPFRIDADLGAAEYEEGSPLKKILLK